MWNLIKITQTLRILHRILPQKKKFTCVTRDFCDDMSTPCSPTRDFVTIRYFVCCANGFCKYTNFDSIFYQKKKLNAFYNATLPKPIPLYILTWNFTKTPLNAANLKQRFSKAQSHNPVPDTWRHCKENAAPSTRARTPTSCLVIEFTEATRHKKFWTPCSLTHNCVVVLLWTYARNVITRNLTR